MLRKLAAGCCLGKGVGKLMLMMLAVWFGKGEAAAHGDSQGRRLVDDAGCWSLACEGSWDADADHAAAAKSWLVKGMRSEC